MTNLYEVFDQTPQPRDVDDLYHILDLSNTLAVIYWDFYFKIVENLQFEIIVECGVGRGRSLIILSHLESYYAIKNSRKPKEIYAFDSFEGFPEPSVWDKSSRNSLKGDWSKSPSGKYKYSPSFIKKILDHSNVINLHNISFFKGFFNDSIPRVKFESIGILHLDGDLYDSVFGPLNLLWEKIIIGGIVVIDDYILKREDMHNEDFPGARKAINDFLNHNDSFKLMESLRGTPYLVRIK